MKWDNACKSLCRREPWRQDLAGSALRTGRHEDPSGVGHQRDADPPHSAPLRGRYQTKVRPSYVEETLFAAPQAPGPHHQTLTPPGGRRPTEPEGWGRGVSQASGANGSCEPTSSRGSTPTLTPRKNKYRLTSQTPSYCGESLAPDLRAPAGRPSGCWGEMLQSSMPSSGQPQLSLGAAIHPTPGRLQRELFTQLVPHRQSAGRWPAPGGCLWMG